MSHLISRTWNPAFIDPSSIRLTKPRKSGLTMMIDKGLGLTTFKDIVQTAANHLDFIKLGFGTSVLYPSQILVEKLEWLKNMT